MVALLALLLALGPQATCRTASGRICRSTTMVHRFYRLTGHPKGWPGHVVDHIIPLCAGGPDTPENMQWQTIAAAKKKDVLERRECAKYSKKK